MGYRIGELVLGEMDVARVHPYRSDQGTPRSRGLVSTPTASGGHPIPGRGGGGDTRSATYRWTTSTKPVYVGRLGMGDDILRGRKRDRCITFCESCYQINADMLRSFHEVT